LVEVEVEVGIEYEVFVEVLVEGGVGEESGEVVE